MDFGLIFFDQMLVTGGQHISNWPLKILKDGGFLL